MKHRVLLVEAHTETSIAISALLNNSFDEDPEVQIIPWQSTPDTDFSLQERPTLIFVPFSIRYQQSYQVLRKLRDHYPAIPIIALGRQGEEGALQAALEHGADDLLLPSDLLPQVLRKTLQHINGCKQLQVEQTEKEDFYHRAFNDCPAPMWLFDKHTLKFLEVNRTAVEVYGYSREEFLDHLTIADIRPKEDLPAFLKNLDEGTPDIGLYSGNWRHRRKDGSIFFVKLYSQDTVYNGASCRMALIIDVHKNNLLQEHNKRLYQKIALQQEETQALLSSLNDVVWSANANDWSLRYINKACESVFGYSSEELLAGRPTLPSLIHPDDQATLNDRIRQLFDKGSLQTSYRIVAKDGTVKHLSSSVSVIRDEEGMPLIVNGIDSDITAQHVAETEHQRTSSELQTVLESITDGFINLDRNWNFTFVNREFERVCRLKREDILGKSYWEVFPKATSQKFYTEYRRAVNDHVSVHFEEYATSLQAWVAVTAYPTETGLTIYFHDITEEKTLRDRILRDEENLKALIDNTADLIWSVDTKYRLITSNSSFQKIHLAITGTDIQPGDSLMANYPPDVLNRWAGYYQRAFSGETFSILEMTTYQGREMTSSDIQFRPVVDNNGNIIGASCFSRDITEQLNYQTAIEQQNETLRRIAWVQSHEVRGPLASILGTVSVLTLTDPIEDHTREELLNGLQEAAERLDSVIRDIDRMTAINEPR